MTHPSSALFPLGVVGLGVVMLVMHRRRRRALGERTLDPFDADFFERTHHRRTRASALLALDGCAMLAGLSVSPRESAEAFVFLWAAVCLITIWVGALAVVDMLDSGRHFVGLGRRRGAVRAELEAEAERLRARARSQRASPT